MVARAGTLLVTGLVLLVDDDKAQVAERAKERRAGAHDHARGTAGDHIPLVQAFTGRKARVEDRNRFAKARAKTADGLGRQRDLGHEYAGRTAGCQHALDGGEVDLGFAGTGDAIDEYHVAVRIQAGALNLRERLLLADGKRDRRLAACRGQRGLLAAATPRTALLHHHDAAFFKRLDGRRHTVVEQVEITRRNRSALERLDELTLADRRFGRRIVEALGREHDPAVLNRLDGGTLNRPCAVIALDHARTAARRQKQAQALGQSRDIFATHPTRNAGGLGAKERFAEDALDGLDARGIEGGVTLQNTQLGRNIDDVACGGTVAKVDQDRRSDLGLVGKGLGDAVSKRFGQRTGGDVENHARVGGNGIRYRLGLGRSFLRFRRTKQRQLLGHDPCISHPMRLQKQEPRSGERGSDT